MEAESPPIIKRVKKVSGDGHHGGAWKVAYADFVTAMMAFFLLMWLLNATSEEQRNGIADYFSPRIPVSEKSGGGDGMFNGDSVFSSKDLVRREIGGVKNEKENDPTDKEEADSDIGAPDASRGEDGVEPGVAELNESGEIGENDGAAVGESDAQEATIFAIENALNTLQQSAEDNELLEHLTLKVTPEGLMIEIVERDGAPLFASGSATASAMMRRLADVVAPILASLENDIAIEGHTDATPFASGRQYGNWELSSDRANAARRLLVQAGLPAERLNRVSGSADRDPLIADDPFAPQNRRIAITLLRDRGTP